MAKAFSSATHVPAVISGVNLSTVSNKASTMRLTTHPNPDLCDALNKFVSGRLLLWLTAR
jgi:hypothetical protein